MLCIFKAKFHWKSISFALIRPVFLTFSNRSYHLLFQQQYAQEMNQWQSIKISWPVPSFLQHKWRLVVSGRCLHVSVTKFQDTFAQQGPVHVIRKSVLYTAVCKNFEPPRYINIFWFWGAQNFCKQLYIIYFFERHEQDP